MKKILCGVAAMAMLVGCAGAAAAQAVDFEDNPSNTAFYPLVSDGFSFEGILVYSWTDGPYSANGTNNLIFSGFPVVMTKVGGGTFSVGNLDAGLSWYASGQGATLDLVGTRADSSTVTASLGLDYMFQSYALNGFDDLVSLSFSTTSNGYVALDNINGADTGAVPEPASWALMLGGFGLVGGAMRSRRKAAVTFA